MSRILFAFRNYRIEILYQSFYLEAMLRQVMVLTKKKNLKMHDKG